MLGKNIAGLRKRLKMSQKEFAAALNISQGAVSQWETERTCPDMSQLLNIASKFNVSVDSLTGISVPKDERTENTVPAKGHRIPVVGDVAAGVPIEAIQDILDYEEIPEELAQTGEYFGLRLKGDSMAPRMQSGDVVIVRQQDDVENGEIAVVLVNGDSATVKQVKKLTEGIMLIPYNKDYETMFYTAQECATLPVRIIGKVIECRIKL